MGISPSNPTEESERLWTALTAKTGTLSVGSRDLGRYLCKVFLFPLFLLVFPKAGEQLPARGLFFSLIQTGFAYRQERRCSVLWAKQCRGMSPQSRRRRASAGSLGSQHCPPPSCPMAGRRKEEALALGPLSWLRARERWAPALGVVWSDARGATENQPTLSKVARRKIKGGHSLAHLVGDDTWIRVHGIHGNHFSRALIHC